jgi:hypothetical protein
MRGRLATCPTSTEDSSGSTAPKTVASDAIRLRSHIQDGQIRVDGPDNFTKFLSAASFIAAAVSQIAAG